MTDRSRDAGTDSSEDEGLEPGGGPKRVVSDESVDDILASLDSTPGADSSDDAVRIAADEPDADGSSDPDGPTAPDEAAGTDESPVPDETADDGGAEPATAERAESERRSRVDAGTTDSIDAAASSLPDDPAEADELATRIERGDVTGADVRAAEAGEGREATPSIDEVDLSMDDLETATSESTGRSDGDDGPLAGSIDREDADSTDDTSTEGTPGLIGRIKALFSR